MSGFVGHVKLSLLNAPNNPELPDRTVRVQRVPAQQALLSVGSDSVIPSIHTFELFFFLYCANLEYDEYICFFFSFS